MPDGWLLKRSDGKTKSSGVCHRGNSRVKWDRRWFVLQGSRLLYYEEMLVHGAPAKGAILVQGASVGAVGQPDEYTFAVQTTERVLTLKASSADEAQRGVDGPATLSAAESAPTINFRS